MGSLHRFDLAPIVSKYNLKTFVETGTARGNSLAWAAANPDFQHLLSCEIEPLLAAGAIARFNEDPRVSIVRMESGLFIGLFATSGLPPALIFLDAHYPGAGYGLGDYAGEGIHEDVRLPLRCELQNLTARPPHDVILIDDLRIYELGDYQDGNLPEGVPGYPTPNGAQWILDLFPFHRGVRLKEDQGYLILMPEPAWQRSDE